MTSPTVSRPLSTPSESERELYRVLQRANLLSYFETFISQGGDDVQQLIEAGEEEFLEIMALVGMASKPLHVRRLQKALQEYGLNQKLPAAVMSSGGVLLPMAPHIDASPSSLVSSASFCLPVNNKSRVSGGAESPGALSIHSDNWSGHLVTHSENPRDEYNIGSPGQTPVLSDAVIRRIASAAQDIAKTLPFFEPKLVQNKKKVSKELMDVVNMPVEAVGRLDEYRKYAAIYGRFDAKRKSDKPLTLHEVSVNEAAAQICFHRSALLTRRDELFPLARQAVRDSGYQYARNGIAKNKGFDCEDAEESSKFFFDEDASFDRGSERCVSEGSQSTDDQGEIDKERLLNVQSAKLSHLSSAKDDCKNRLDHVHLIHGDLRRHTAASSSSSLPLISPKRPFEEGLHQSYITRSQQQRDVINLAMKKRGRHSSISASIKTGADSTTAVLENNSFNGSDFSVDSTSTDRQSLIAS